MTPDPRTLVDLELTLPNLENAQVPEGDFLAAVDRAWFVCDRMDLQTDIWRGRILRVVRDREKGHHSGVNGSGQGFLRWLAEHEISKSQAYQWIHLANSADTLISGGYLEPEDVSRFSRRAFIETAQAAPEVQQLVSEAARQGERITRREVRHLADQWMAVSSELISDAIREKVSQSTLSPQQVAPLVRELEKLPPAHQRAIAMVVGPDPDELKQATAEAQVLNRYLKNSDQIQALQDHACDLESALAEAQRVGSLRPLTEALTAAAQLEGAIAKLYTTWRRLALVLDRLEAESSASTPHLRTVLAVLSPLSNSQLAIHLGGDRLIGVELLVDDHPEDAYIPEG
ncbi:MAG: hypothetical protein HC919_13630 [Oscillatoriales cyanobacterium SM2_2_1]|nr:hypothetical protein [Oscillatoriales cyanobacterium SM2_2_1]